MCVCFIERDNSNAIILLVEIELSNFRKKTTKEMDSFDENSDCAHH